MKYPPSIPLVIVGLVLCSFGCRSISGRQSVLANLGDRGVSGFDPFFSCLDSLVGSSDFATLGGQSVNETRSDWQPMDIIITTRSIDQNHGVVIYSKDGLVHFLPIVARFEPNLTDKITRTYCFEVDLTPDQQPFEFEFRKQSEGSLFDHAVILKRYQTGKGPQQKQSCHSIDLSQPSSWTSPKEWGPKGHAELEKQMIVAISRVSDHLRAKLDALADVESSYDGDTGYVEWHRAALSACREAVIDFPELVTAIDVELFELSTP